MVSQPALSVFDGTLQVWPDVPLGGEIMTDTMLVEGPTADVRVEQSVQLEREQERFWVRGGWDVPIRIRGVEHLTVLLTTLRPAHSHAGITDEATGAWAQVKRAGERWWVEGRGPSEEWPGVFVPEGWLDVSGPQHLKAYACWNHTMAAELVWAFLDGGAIAGVIRLPAPGGDSA